MKHPSPSTNDAYARLREAASAVLVAVDLAERRAPSAPTACARALNELAWLQARVEAAKHDAEHARASGARSSLHPDRISLH